MKPSELSLTPWLLVIGANAQRWKERVVLIIPDEQRFPGGEDIKRIVDSNTGHRTGSNLYI